MKKVSLLIVLSLFSFSALGAKFDQDCTDAKAQELLAARRSLSFVMEQLEPEDLNMDIASITHELYGWNEDNGDIVTHYVTSAYIGSSDRNHKNWYESVVTITKRPKTSKCLVSKAVLSRQGKVFIGGGEIRQQEHSK
jgi:hypothetical protein